jgi:phosphopantetheinyl transferase
MSRLQFWTLNLTSAVLVLLLAAHFLMSRLNSRLADELNRQRAYINNANQVSAVLDRMAQRIALGSDTDPRLRDLLIKYGLSVTLEVEGKKKSYP